MKQTITALKSSKPVYVEDSVVKGGDKRYYDTVKVAMRDQQEAHLRLAGLSRNITERKQAEELIERLHHQNELILNSAGEGIYGVDLNGNTTFANPAAARMIGWEPEELIGKQQHDILHHSKPDGTPYPKADCQIYAAFKDGNVHHVNDEVFWRKDGTSFPVEYTSTPIWEDNRLVGAVVVFKDITELKRTEENLKLFSQAIEEAMDGIQIVDLEGQIIYSNTAVEEIYGYSSGEIIGKHVSELNVDNELARKVIIPSIKETGRWSGELTVRHKEGHEFPIWLSASMVKNDAGEPIAMLGIIRDVTRRKRAEEVLRRSHDELEILVAERTAELTMVNDQLRNLSAYLQNARENERTMIAREIHDELGQSLTALKMDLSLLRKRLPKGDRPVIEKTESMARLIETTIRSVKKISTDLRPGILDHLGLIAAIEWQAEEFEKRTGIRCVVSFDPEEVILDKDRTTTVFRIFQEALTNVARHAKATEISVLLNMQADGLMLQVRDNGRGITEKQATAPKSLGLIGVRERVYYWGGTLTIDGSRNKGTTITVQIPLGDRRETR